MFRIFRFYLNRTVVARRWICKSQGSSASEMPNPTDLCTGLQKKEILAYMEGKCDPFHIDIIKRGCGTKDDPTLIPSAFNGRIVGCICNDNRFVNYMWLEKGCPKRCECGHWYKLHEVQAFS